MALRAAVDAGAGGSIVNSVTGTANQITAAPATGAVVLSIPATFIPASIPNYISGLTLSTTGSSATFGIATGAACDTTNVAVMSLTSAYTKTTATWAVGSGNGSLDTGAIANATWYHVWLILRADTGVVDVLTSLSATSPTVPVGYTSRRRIGAMLTNGSAQWILFTQFGNQFLWSTNVNNYNGTLTSGVAALKVTTAPTGVNVIARLRGTYSDTSQNTGMLINSPSEASTTVNSPSGNVTAISPVAAGAALGTYQLDVLTDTSAQVRVITNSSTATVTFETFGWVDLRGFI